jgi:hypothetical protein
VFGTFVPPTSAYMPTMLIQVVSDYLTSFDDQAAYLKARNRPIVVYTYRMSFSRERPQHQGGGLEYGGS